MFRFIYSEIKKNLKKIKFVRLILYKTKSGYEKYKVFDFLKKESIFIDFGSNIGDVSTYINDKFGCKIYCYEPHPRAFEQLKEKFKKCQNIQTINYAVSNQNSEQNFYLHKETSDKNDLLYSQAASLEEKFSLCTSKEALAKVHRQPPSWATTSPRPRICGRYASSL